MTEPQDVLAEALHATGECENWSPGYRSLVGEDVVLDEFGDSAAHRRSASDILAALAARGYALVRTPETLDAGTTTDCPLEGVHEHPFRGPHRFHEWDPSSYFTLNDRPPVRTPETLDGTVDRVVEALFNEGLLRDDQNDATYHRRVGEVVARAAIAGASR